MSRNRENLPMPGTRMVGTPALRIRRGIRGEGNIGCIIWAVVLAIVVLICLKAVPVKIKTSEFQDYIREQAKFSTRTSAKKVEARVFRKARELDLPLDRKNLLVEKIGNERIRIKASYTVLLEFPGYTYQWHFKHEVDRAIYDI